MTTWRAARAEADVTLTGAALARQVHLPPFGDIPLHEFITALVTEFLAHAWDIGSAVGVPVRLDPELIPGSLAWARRSIKTRSPKAVGPALTPPPEADPQEQPLAYLGRNTAVGHTTS